MGKRPDLNKDISIEDFRDFYWYKNELIEFCRVENLDKKGGKIELTNRIEKYLITGEREKHIKNTQKKTSKYDWNNEKLTLETIITDNYKNTQNVRKFFISKIGDRFRFNIEFMNWMKSANGKTLNNAIDKWLEISLKSKINKSPKEIGPQFEYNTYIRDFLKDNPTVPRERAIKCWKIKKSMRGDNKYTKSDLELTEE